MADVGEASVDWMNLRGIDMETHVSSKERIAAKSAALAFIIGVQDDADVFDGHHKGKSPYDDGEHLYDLVLRRGFQERGRVHVEGTGDSQR